MRSIRFRGKRIDNGEWAYGYYCKIENDHCIIAIDNEWHHEGRGDFIGDYVEVDPKTVGQFTGLHDKNGKEICEGDKIEDRFSNGKIYYEGIVFWGRCKAYEMSNQDNFYAPMQVNDSYGFLLKKGEPLNKTCLLRPVGEGNKICEEDIVGEGGKFVVGNIQESTRRNKNDQGRKNTKKLRAS